MIPNRLRMYLCVRMLKPFLWVCLWFSSWTPPNSGMRTAGLFQGTPDLPQIYVNPPNSLRVKLDTSWNDAHPCSKKPSDCFREKAVVLSRVTLHNRALFTSEFDQEMAFTREGELGLRKAEGPHGSSQTPEMSWSWDKSNLLSFSTLFNY